MRETPITAAHPPACNTCANELDSILAEHTLQASFRPIADFARCEILGYISSAHGPAGMLHGSYRRLVRTSRQLGRLPELACAVFDAIVRRFIDNQGKGLLFAPVPEGAIEAGGLPLAEAICSIVNPRTLAFERLALLIPGIDTDKLALGADWLGHMRACGFRIASLNPGCGLAEEQLWSQVAPDFVFLDEQMFDGGDLATIDPSYGFAAKLAAEMIGDRVVVARGIGGSNDFNALKQMGIQYGAGDFIGRANSVPTRALSAAAHKAIAAYCECGGESRQAPGGVLERLLTKPPTVTPTTSADEVFFLFERVPELRAIAVIDGAAPRGLISRYEMGDKMGRPYRHELYGRKPCTRFMDPRPLTVDIGVSLQELTEIVVGADPRHLISGFIITDRGAYLGMGSVQDLVREVTTMQMEAAKYANPLTQLSGNVPINQHIDNLLSAGEACCIAYCDLDHFKPFNDVYGYAKGDEVIKLTARVLVDVCDGERDFFGHIGGDDFVMIFRSEDWIERCKRALEKFGAEIFGFFSTDDIERGGYITENRKGNMEFHHLTTLSIGAVEAAPGKFQNHLQIAKVAAEVKKRAKAIAGNSLYVNQRLYDADQ